MRVDVNALDSGEGVAAVSFVVVVVVVVAPLLLFLLFLSLGVIDCVGFDLLEMESAAFIARAAALAARAAAASAATPACPGCAASTTLYSSHASACLPSCVNAMARRWCALTWFGSNAMAAVASASAPSAQDHPLNSTTRLRFTHPLNSTRL